MVRPMRMDCIWKDLSDGRLESFENALCRVILFCAEGTSMKRYRLSPNLRWWMHSVFAVLPSDYTLLGKVHSGGP
jgi:hypothetical protein